MIDEFGRLDLVVSNVGFPWDGIAHTLSDEQFSAVLSRRGRGAAVDQV